MVEGQSSSLGLYLLMGRLLEVVRRPSSLLPGSPSRLPGKDLLVRAEGVGLARLAVPHLDR